MSDLVEWVRFMYVVGGWWTESMRMPKPKFVVVLAPFFFFHMMRVVVDLGQASLGSPSQEI